MFFFFFSSRRRHTRFSRDWSSDVCSSDLGRNPGGCRELEYQAALDHVVPHTESVQEPGQEPRDVDASSRAAVLHEAFVEERGRLHRLGSSERFVLWSGPPEIHKLGVPHQELRVPLLLRHESRRVVEPGLADVDAQLPKCGFELRESLQLPILPPLPFYLECGAYEPGALALMTSPQKLDGFQLEEVTCPPETGRFAA